jgi:hypothetical protein
VSNCTEYGAVVSVPIEAPKGDASLKYLNSTLVAPPASADTLTVPRRIEPASGLVSVTVGGAVDAADGSASAAKVAANTAILVLRTLSSPDQSAMDTRTMCLKFQGVKEETCD